MDPSLLNTLVLALDIPETGQFIIDSQRFTDVIHVALTRLHVLNQNTIALSLNRKLNCGVGAASLCAAFEEA
jgi:hypothetical protein